MSETRIPEALALLREKGWCKGDYDDDEGRHCITGALIETYEVQCLGNASRYLNDDSAIRDVLKAQYGSRSISLFNDDPATTFADVEFVLEKAILERGGSL